ncbi:hypothetical protein ACJIZ3_009535 [Penstemon smallii]|uniref:Uncharacterized protein n=1 Tax=Penstemon smallii TaxID=265156 RepID=A0ABD3TCS9_9LAMI
MRNISEKETPNFLLPVYPSGEPLILSGTAHYLGKTRTERVVLAVAEKPDVKKN